MEGPTLVELLICYSLIRKYMTRVEVSDTANSLAYYATELVMVVKILEFRRRKRLFFIDRIIYLSILFCSAYLFNNQHVKITIILDLEFSLL
jgi:hypothetical protein